MKRFFAAKTIIYCAVMYLMFILPYGYMAMNATTGSYENPLVKIIEIGFLVLSFPSSLVLIPAYFAGGEYIIFAVICLPIFNSLAWKWIIQNRIQQFAAAYPIELCPIGPLSITLNIKR